MKNWKTTLVGVGGAIAYLVYKFVSTHSITGEDITLALTLAGVGLSAKDNNVTGGTTKQ